MGLKKKNNIGGASTPTIVASNFKRLILRNSKTPSNCGYNKTLAITINRPIRISVFMKALLHPAKHKRTVYDHTEQREKPHASHSPFERRNVRYALAPVVSRTRTKIVVDESDKLKHIGHFAGLL